ALGSRDVDIVRPSLEYITGGTSKRAPVSFVTRIVPVPRSTASDRVTETCFGADGRIGALGEGVELTYWAWAEASPLASIAPTKIAKSANGSPRRLMAPSVDLGTSVGPSSHRLPPSECPGPRGRRPRRAATEGLQSRRSQRRVGTADRSRADQRPGTRSPRPDSRRPREPSHRPAWFRASPEDARCTCPPGSGSP